MADSYFKPFHQWEVLSVGESIVVPLPIHDLVHIQERLTRERKMGFKLTDLKAEFGPIKTRVERVK